MLLAGVVLAGCTNDPTTDEAAIPMLTLNARDLPSHIKLGDSVTLGLHITGDNAGHSDHIGAHYWSASTDDPTADFGLQAGSCSHVAGGGQVPGDFTIVCTPTESGWHYLRGHVRLVVDDETLNYWTPEHVIFVTPA